MRWLLALLILIGALSGPTPGARGQGEAGEEAQEPHALPAVVTEASRPYETAGLGDEEPPAWKVFVGRLHPLLVHFPIALLLTALLAELMNLIRPCGACGGTARVCLVLGAISAAAAAFCGHSAADSVGVDSSLAALLERHELLGNVTAGLAILAVVVSEWSRRQKATIRSARIYRIVLVAAAALVGVTGHYGGMMVFGPDHFG